MSWQSRCPEGSYSRALETDRRSRPECRGTSPYVAPAPRPTAGNRRRHRTLATGRGRQWSRWSRCSPSGRAAEQAAGDRAYSRRGYSRVGRWYAGTSEWCHPPPSYRPPLHSLSTPSDSWCHPSPDR